MDEILSLVNQYLDLQYIFGIIVISRAIMDYVPFTKNSAWVQSHRGYVVYGLATVVAAGFIIYAKCCVPGLSAIAYGWKLMLSYFTATSIYEVVGQRVFEAIERVFGVNAEKQLQNLGAPAPAVVPPTVAAPPVAPPDPK